MLLGDPPDVLVLSNKKSSNKPMLVNSQGKSRLENEVSSCGGPHVYHVMQFESSQYFKIIQDWSTVIWISTMAMTCPLHADVE